MSDKSYNGWTNYETWCVNLWLSNDEGLYIEATDRTNEVVAEDDSRSEYWSLEDSRVYTLADDFKAWVCDELAPDIGASMAAALLGAALSEVDWQEIAKSWIESVSE